jgi:hypothetical protein
MEHEHNEYREERVKGPEDRVGYQFKREMALVAVVAAPMVLGAAWTLGTSAISAYNNVLSILANHDKQLAVHNEYRANDEAANAAQQLRIVSLEQTVRDVERRVVSMQTDPKERPDPNTGSQGRERDRRIDRLEELLLEKRGHTK